MISEEAWQRVAHLIPPAKFGGRPRETDPRALVSAILYWKSSGEGWRSLPKTYPPWGTVHYYYTRWQREGLWSAIEEALL